MNCWRLPKSLSSDTMMGLIYPAGRNEATICDFLPYFWAQGGELVDEEGTPIFGEGDNRQYMINALDFIGRTVSEGASPARVTQYNKEAEMVADIAAGNVAMFVGGNYAAQPIREAMGKEEFDNLWKPPQSPRRTPTPIAPPPADGPPASSPRRRKSAPCWPISWHTSMWKTRPSATCARL